MKIQGSKIELIMTEQKIKQGDWFCAIEGLAIADKIFDFYFEDFDKIPQGNKVGDYKSQLFNIGCSVLLTEIR